MTTISRFVKGPMLTAAVILPVLLGVFLCLRHGFGIQIPLPVVSLLSAAVVVVAWMKDRAITIDVPLAAFVAVYGLGLALHPTPEPWLRSQRFIAFVIGLSCFSPLLQSGSLAKARRVAAVVMYAALVVMVALSFLTWLGCLALHGTDGVWLAGFHYYGFRGVFDMGMSLSPAAAMVAIVALSRLFRCTRRRNAVVFGALFMIGFIMCAVGGSRMSFLGLAVSVVTLALLNRGEIARLMRRRRVVITVVAGVLVFAFVAPGAFTVIKHKNSLGGRHHSVIYSREELWGNRIEEFKSSPLVGIGYANEHPSARNDNGNLSRIEPGSSWLSLLSYGGLAGAGVFLWFLVSLARRLFCIRHRRQFPPLLAMLLFLAVNATTEGWLMFSGALMFPIFWMTVSSIYNNKRIFK